MTESVKPKNKGKKILFASPLLESLSRTHISVPIIVFCVYACALLFWSVTTTHLSVWKTVLLFFVGLLSFTWVEYVMHRYVFHMSVTSDLRSKWQYMMHGVHHEFPKDKGRLAMPPLVSVTVATLLLLIFRIVLGDLAFSILPGFLTGYAAYLGVHYMIHAHQPPRNFLKALWINHSVHHYKNGESVFGVSSPLWDYVYGTMENSPASGVLHHHDHGAQRMIKSRG